MEKNEIMTLEEVANFLRMSERTVTEWVNNGKLPGGKFGTSWRFQRTEVENWVNFQLSLSPKSISEESESLISLLSKERILFLETQNKEETINKLIDVSYKIPEIKNREQLAEAVFNREKLMSTGIGLGIGVPHVRLNGMKNLYMSMAINKNGITNYDSLDDMPVKIVILIIASNTQHSRYIKVLSQIAQIMKNTGIHKNLMNAKNSEEIFKILKEGNNK